MFEGFKPRQDLVGFTAIPNEWFDSILASIDNLAEIKIVQTVFRKTYGWVESWEGDKPIYKIEDEISYTQFAELTGLSTASISEGIKKAIAHGYIIQVKRGSFTTRVSSSYRIRMAGDKAQTLEEIGMIARPTGVGNLIASTTLDTKAKEEVIPTSKSKAKEALQSKASITSSSKASLTLSSKGTIETIEKERKDRGTHETPTLTREVFSTEKVKSKKGKTQFEKYKEKEIKDYHANDIGYYFSEKYESLIGYRYGKITNKDRSLMKQMIDMYSSETVVKGIDYLMKNYHTLIDGYPSIPVLYGFRNTIIPSAEKGKTPSKLNVRETRLSEEEIEQLKEDKDIIQW